MATQPYLPRITYTKSMPATQVKAMSGYFNGKMPVKVASKVVARKTTSK